MNTLFFSTYRQALDSLAFLAAQLTSHAHCDIQNVTITNLTWERT